MRGITDWAKAANPKAARAVVAAMQARWFGSKIKDRTDRQSALTPTVAWNLPIGIILERDSQTGFHDSMAKAALDVLDMHDVLR